MSDIEDLKRWYNGIPRITKWWFTGSVIVPVAASIGLVKPHSLILMFGKVFQGLQLWRPITAALYHQTGWFRFFHYLLTLFYLYHYSIRLETGYFAGKKADYAFLLLFNWACLVIVGFFFEAFMLMSPLVLSVLCVSCLINKDVDMLIWRRELQFKADKIPWIMLIINILFGEGFFELFGVAVGHLYYFLKFTYPQKTKGDQILITPRFLYRIFGFPITPFGFGSRGSSERGVGSTSNKPTSNISGFGQAPASRRTWSEKNK